MQRVLVDPVRGTTHDVVALGSEFDVADPLKWIDCPDDFTSDAYTYSDDAVVPVVVDIVDVRVAARQRIGATRNDILDNLSVSYLGTEFDADEVSVQRMTSAFTMLQLFAADPRAPKTIGWLDSTNRPRNLSAAQLGELAARAWLAQEAVWLKNATAKAAIEDAADAAAVKAVAWPT